MLNTLKKHWPEYLMEAAELGIFMISACVFAILLYHPSSPVVAALPTEFARRVLMGMAMGLTLVGIVFSPWGKQSGAHMNPAFTLMFLRLGKIALWDAVFYVIAQFGGAIAGVFLMSVVFGRILAHPSVDYVATVPGSGGIAEAFFGEVVISFLLVTVVLTISNHTKLAGFTGIFAAGCVALFITFESPISGMSMNPARTLGSAVLPGLWNSLWIYFVAPPLGMLLAAFVRDISKRPVACAKLHHQNNKRCIFCEYQQRRLRHAKIAEDAKVVALNS